MRILLIILITSKYLFPVSGVITFNDGTKIEGDISNVSDKSISIIPMGLTFPEEIRMENVDSLKFSDGSLLVANNKLLYLYVNGEFLKPGTSINNNKDTESQDYAVEYVLVPNWSANVYTGYPIIRASSFDEFDKSNIVFGLSVGTPYGIYAGDFFVSVIAEFAYYNFQQKNNLDGPSFGGPAFQIGLSPGLFIGDYSFSLTACTGVYQNDLGELTSGFIAGGSIDIPLGTLLDNDDLPIELRITSRSNLISKDEGVTGWIDGGVSIGYEF